MGARQSKRSVDITNGKETAVEGSEIAGAGGEGKLERIEDIDDLKPQQNGDAAHQEVEISDKEKQMQLDEVIENVKDTSNEKEIILSPVNGDNGETPKEVVENIESETNKKNKKEKSKRKWSFRTISFGKKDKQKPAKKEETNGECEKVPEEVAENAAAATEQPEAKTEAEPTEAAKVEVAEKAQEKTPETPVTEPLTNGSSAPESPKEEIRQNGDATSTDEPSPVVEKKEEIAPEPAKPEPIPADVPSVESQMNGLKVEEAVEEPKIAPECKIEETPEKAIPEPVEVKATEIGETEVCVVKETHEVAQAAETAPPLPVTAPPSSLTIFAETTMAPHLVDNPVVGDLPVVDLGASLSSAPSPTPVTDVKDTLIANNEVQSESDNKVEDVPSALPVDNVSVVEGPQDVSNETAAPQTSEIVPETIAPAASAVADSDIVKETVVENLAVVSPAEPEPVKPDPEVTPTIPEPQPETPVSDAIVAENIPAAVDESKASENITIPEVVASVIPVEIPVESVNASAVETEKPIVEDVVVSEQITVDPLNSVDNISECAQDSALPPVSISESPLPQRTPSDPDVSDVAFGEPQSDSFPLPPPPVSCLESMAEISVSESLPPPLSECSQTDTVLNSPTSEALDFPPKDLPSPIKDNDNSVASEALVLTNGEAQLTTTAMPEIDIPPPAELTSEPTIVAESPKEINGVEESKKLPSADATQVKTVIDNNIDSFDSQTMPELVSIETAVATE